jgi:predicted amidohydrolase
MACAFKNSSGASALISPTGKVLAEAGDTETVVTARLDLEEMTKFRRYLPCFSDRLPGSYGIA